MVVGIGYSYVNNTAEIVDSGHTNVTPYWTMNSTSFEITRRSFTIFSP